MKFQFNRTFVERNFAEATARAIISAKMGDPENIDGDFIDRVFNEAMDRIREAEAKSPVILSDDDKLWQSFWSAVLSRFDEIHPSYRETLNDALSGTPFPDQVRDADKFPYKPLPDFVVCGTEFYTCLIEKVEPRSLSLVESNNQEIIH